MTANATKAQERDELSETTSLTGSCSSSWAGAEASPENSEGEEVVETTTMMQALTSPARATTTTITSNATTTPTRITGLSATPSPRQHVVQQYHLHRTSPISPVSVPTGSNNAVATVTPSRNDNPTDDSRSDNDNSDSMDRTRALADKRIQLGRQRVQLEQRLFEYAALNRAAHAAPTAWEPQQPTLKNKTNPKPSPMSMSVSSSSSSSSLLTSSSSSSSSSLPISSKGSSFMLSLSKSSSSFVSPVKSAASPSLLKNPATRQKTTPQKNNNNKTNFRPLVSLQWQELEFPDGQVYQGQIMVIMKRCTTASDSPEKTKTTTDYIRHGHGWNRWLDGQAYRGEWHENRRHGRGTHAWPDGRSVTGHWHAGHLHGRIFFVWPDQSTYDGDAVCGKKQGRGVQTWRKQICSTSSTGEQQQQQIHQRVYSGQYEAGYEHGFGTLTETVGDQVISKYRGQFRYGKRHGYGVQSFKRNDKTYDGEWQNNMIHGRGKFSWSNGASYTGSFQLGRYHGNGSYNDGKGKKYVGQWKNGEKHGMGKQLWPNGKSYHGHFFCGRRHGYGQMRYADGRVYSGGWKEGKRCGQGIEVEPNGVVIHCGQWKHNKRATQAVLHTKKDTKSSQAKAKDDVDFYWTNTKPQMVCQRRRQQVNEAEAVLDMRRNGDDDAFYSFLKEGMENTKEPVLLYQPPAPQARSLDDSFDEDVDDDDEEEEEGCYVESRFNLRDQE